MPCIFIFTRRDREVHCDKFSVDDFYSLDYELNEGVTLTSIHIASTDKQKGYPLESSVANVEYLKSIIE